MNASRQAPAEPPPSPRRLVPTPPCSRQIRRPCARSSVDGVVGRLEAEHEHRERAVAGAGLQRLELVDQTAVRGVEARTARARARPPRRAGTCRSAPRARRGAPDAAGPAPTRSVITPSVPSEPSSIRSGRGPGAGSRQPARLPLARGGDRAHALDEVVDVGEPVAKCPPARVAIQPPSVESSNDCGKKRIVRPCGPSCSSTRGPLRRPRSGPRARPRRSRARVERAEVERQRAVETRRHRAAPRRPRRSCRRRRA